jgi:phage terminase small subunit
MPVLKNSRHEAFAQARVKGEAVDQAYVSAGYTYNRGNAARLNANESVMKRISELQGKVAEKVQIDAAWVLAKAVALHDHCAAEPVLRNGEPVLDEKGNPVTRYNAAGVSKALDLIGKHVGVQAFQEKAIVEMTHNYANATDAELDMKIASLLSPARPKSKTAH